MDPLSGLKELHVCVCVCLRHVDGSLGSGGLVGGRCIVLSEFAGVGTCLLP